MTSHDPFDLERFVAAQSTVYASVVRELKQSRKRSHWMWFIFPQIAGLGMSSMSQRYAISSIDEARAYLEHPILGERLCECTRLVLDAEGFTAREIFGSIDELKFRSSLTLFAKADPAEPSFQQALERYFAGEPDPTTLELLRMG